MTLYQLKALVSGAESNGVWSGAFLAERVTWDDYILLYDLGGLYAEVHYCRNLNQITTLTFFKATSLLEPYLNQINLKF
jgi:hypothetical protein